MAASVAVMVMWLIAVHGLWERPSGKEGRQRTPLFNATTAAALLIAGCVLGGVLGHPAGPATTRP